MKEDTTNKNQKGPRLDSEMASQNKTLPDPISFPMPTKTVETVDPKVLFQSFLDSIEASLTHLSNQDKKLIEKAYYFSEQLHKNQKRKSGEPYILHPMAVTSILASYQLDMVSLIAGLLHDTLEDTSTTLSEIEKEFGPEVASLVDGLTKIGRITFRTHEEKQAENFRKMILAMAKDIRVIIIKLADRLHNMRTLEYLDSEHQFYIAQETIEIYCPIAHRLGLFELKRELEDLGLRFTNPEMYLKISKYVSKRLQERKEYHENTIRILREKLLDHGFHDFEVSGRPKHFYSIYKKMESKNLSFDEIYDISAIRIIVQNIEQCYGVLGVIHSLWTPVQGRFKDYIAIPKSNLYQSLHTTVIGPLGERVEIQIRTQEMHQTAEKGIAAHWIYKKNPIQTTSMKKNQKDYLAWVNQLVEWQRDVKDPMEFLETVKLDLFNEDIYVFTPIGEVMEFPQGATPVDFAYTIHTDLGHHCSGAKVNGRMVSLKHKLKNGDTVEIITQSNQNPSKDWLKFVKTSRAKNKIRNYIKLQEYENALQIGRLLVEKELMKYGKKIKPFLTNGSLLDIAMKQYHVKSINDFFSHIGYGKLSAQVIVSKLIPEVRIKKDKNLPMKSHLQRPLSESKGGSGGARGGGGESEIFRASQQKKMKPTNLKDVFSRAASLPNPSTQSIRIKDMKNLLIRFARCCNPLQGEAVIGYITFGRGISVHLRKCQKIVNSDPNRLIELEWDADTLQEERFVKLKVTCNDRPGLLFDLSQIITNQHINIKNARVETTKDKKALCFFSINIPHVKHLKKIVDFLNQLPDVISVERL